MDPLKHIDCSAELSFITSRSGGKGGQNVNKVETAVTGFWDIGRSTLLTDEQKSLLKEKLSNRINDEGLLFVKSQVHRTQLSNKDEVIKKMNSLVNGALEKKKKRLKTKISAAAKQKRLESKKRNAEIKSGRRKIRGHDNKE
jgi:ribosome-associated protein